MRSEFAPAYPVAANGREMILTENADGDFFVVGNVNGVPVKFLVDTGSSDVVLSPADAQRLGIDLSTLSFNRVYETANGEGRGASYIVDSLEIGPVKIPQMTVSVNRAKMNSSLLGMTFLKQMKSFEIRGRRMYLRWR
jgi:aspartyl protease family protein